MARAALQKDNSDVGTFNLRVDSHLKKLVAAGPLLAASGFRVHNHVCINNLT